MITIARHIELLLLEHDCVIVPSFGGFIANRAEARYEGNEENLFLPPYRSVGFNPQLKLNDGLLVQSYMAAYDASYPNALLQMEKDVDTMTSTLEQTGVYELEGIGTLKKELNNNISFIAPKAGINTPSLYGLYSYEIQPIADVRKSKEVAAALQAAAMQVAADDEKKNSAHTQNDSTSHKDIVIRLSRRWLDVCISAAAAVLLFFCFSYPAMKNTCSETDTVVATFYPMSSTDFKPETPETAKPTTSDVEKTVKNEIKQEEDKKEIEQEEDSNQKEQEEDNNQKEQEKTIAEPRYTIVLACHVSKDNAETFIHQLSKAGFGEGRYVKTDKISRVLYSDYDTEAAAHSALQQLRQEHPSFAEAWVLEL